MSTVATDRPLLTIPQVAERLAVSEKTVRRLVERGDLPALRVGFQIRIDVAQLEGWLYADPADPFRPVDDPAERAAPNSSSSRSAVEAVPLAGRECHG